MIEDPKAPPEQQAPYSFGPLPPLLFEEFEGINTQTTRPGVDDKQAYWMDGFMPISRRNLRTLPDIGASKYTPGGGKHIVCYDFANIGTAPLAIVFLDDGSVQQVNTTSGAVTQILAAGTITAPAINTVGVSQWGSQYVIIVANQTNGYWVWDGTLAYGAGGISPVITVTAGGSGYTSPIATASGGSGSGIVLVATQVGGVVTSIAVTAAGTGYLATDTVIITITDGGPGTGATATLKLMPFGINGSTVETYTGRVWVGAGARIQFSAPGDVFNFSTASGGGNFTSTDSFLRVGFSQLRQSNGFLYLVADSSINYISGVQTSGSPPTTTFTNQNADPEVGSPYAGTVDVFGRNILLANSVGAHVSYGAAVTKISEPLDGVWNTVASFGGFQLSAAKATIYGKKVWMVLAPVVDPITSIQVNKLFMWDSKKWWSSQQSVTLIFVAHQEINSVLTAWGTDGLSLYPLFQTPSVNFTKTVQTKFWDRPGYQWIKTTNRLWGLFTYSSLSELDLNITIDNENSKYALSIALTLNQILVVNNVPNVIPVKNQDGTTIPVINGVSGGIAVLQPQAIAQQGVLTGWTVSTNNADVTMISMALSQEMAPYRG